MKTISTKGWAMAGSLVLGLTAAFHSSGFAEVAAAADASGLEPTFAGIFKGLWLFVSLHWLFLAVLALVAARFPSRAASAVLGLAALLLVIDVALLLVFVGPFVGEALLGLTAVCYAAAALSGRRDTGGMTPRAEP